MMGTISGSGVANVVTVGQFTIPLMIKFGYRRAFAAGVEATASMGGQIMPPVMGAVAFIMAETLGRRICRDRQGRGDPGDPVFRLRVLDGASGGRQARPGRHAALGNPERLEGAGGALVSGVAAGRAGLHAVRRLHAALRRQHGAGADGGADPRRQHHARAFPIDRCAIRVLDRARAGGGRRSRKTVWRSFRSAGIVGVLVLVDRVHARRPRDACEPAAMRWPTAPSRR